VPNARKRKIVQSLEARRAAFSQKARQVSDLAGLPHVVSSISWLGTLPPIWIVLPRARDERAAPCR